MLRLYAELKDKLAPLLRLQASDNDGARANANPAITRLLERHGADWLDLLEILLGPSLQRNRNRYAARRGNDRKARSICRAISCSR